MLPRLRLTAQHFRPTIINTPLRATTGAAMSKFTLRDSHPEVPVHLTSDLNKDQLLSFPAFKTWISTLKHSLTLQNNGSHTFHTSPYHLRKIDIQSVDFFGGGRLGFVKLKAEISNDNGESLPGSVFLRGGSVGMMVCWGKVLLLDDLLFSRPLGRKISDTTITVQLILQPDDVKANTESEKQVILTLQPRIPAGSLSLPELPAGMLDDSGTFSGGAAKEISEETGLEISEKELIDMTKLALPSSSSDKEEQLQQGVYPSPGGCDEFVPIFLWQKRVPRDTLKEWQGKLTGLRDHGEKITLMLCPLEKVWKVGGRDGKVLAGWALYEGLRKEGKI